MNDQDPHPYAPPASEPAFRAELGNVSMVPADRKKLDAVIKDANQFWIAILFCFLCSALGLVIIGPWYLVRLLQWKRLGNTYPELLQVSPASGTVYQQFQSAKWKLMTGLIFGLSIVLLVIVAVAAIG